MKDVGVKRGELEMRLLDDEEFRARILELREAKEKVQQAEEAKRLAKLHYHRRIRDMIVEEGVPAASVARYVDIPLTSVNWILRQSG
jgi:hypothetical protein